MIITRRFVARPATLAVLIGTILGVCALKYVVTYDADAHQKAHFCETAHPEVIF